MATTTNKTIDISDQAKPIRETEQRSWVRFEFITVLLSFWYIGGLFIDGWAHNHGITDESFFTVWHAVFYSGFAVVAAFYAYTVWNNVNQSKAWSQVLPKGHHLSLVGIVIFALGGGVDMLWHEILGIEEDIEALLSPSHLMLGAGMLLIFSGAFRAFAFRKRDENKWIHWLPAVLSMTFTVSVLMFFVQYLSPTGSPIGFYFPENEAAEHNQLYIMNADGTEQTRLTSSSEFDQFHPSVSPDGTQIAFTQTTGEEQSNIFVMDLDGSNITQITENESLNYEPTWSANGERIAFVSTRDDNEEIYVIDIATGEETRLTNNDWNDALPAWSPDGTQLAYVSDETGNMEIYVMDADGNNVTQITDNPAFDGFPAWSPDGTQLAFSSERGDSDNIFIVDIETQEVEQVTDSEFSDFVPSWTPDGESIVYSQFGDTNSEIFSISLDGGDPVNLSNNASTSDGFATVAPDGSIVYRVRPETPLDMDDTNDLLLVYSLSSILISSLLLVGGMMLLLREGRPPFGAFTLLWTITYALLATQDDGYGIIAIAFVTGLAADFLVRVTNVQIQEGWRFMSFAFIVPALFFSIYFAFVQFFIGISWSIDVWTGSIVLAGTMGMLIAYVIHSSVNATASYGAA